MPSKLVEYRRNNFKVKATHKEVLTLVSKKEGRPDVHFVDVGAAFIDPKIQREREKAAAHRAELRAKKRAALAKA